MKRAIVFGATSDIGTEITRELAQAGWSLYLHYFKNQVRVQNLQAELQTKFPQQDFLPFQLDFLATDLTTFAEFLPVNALVFAQGITDYNFYAAQSQQTIDEIFQVDLLQPLKIIKYFENRLKSQEHSRIILIGSVYGKVGSAMEVAYSTTKGALSAFANAYAREVAPQITVNVVAPGAVQTKMLADFSDEDLLNLRAEIPSNRLATPADIAYQVLAVLDERADYLTGQTIYVDGGWQV